MESKGLSRDGPRTSTAERVDHLQRFLRWLLRARVFRLARPWINGVLLARSKILGRERLRVPVRAPDEAIEVRVEYRPPGSSAFSLQAVAEMERKLWGGYASEAAVSLMRCMGSRRESAIVRAEAAWALVRLHALTGDYSEALRFALLVRALEPRKGWESGLVLLEVDCLNRLARSTEAREVLDDVVSADGKSADYCLAYANTYAEESEGVDLRLAWFNEIYRTHGVGILSLKEGSHRLVLGNLVGAAVRGKDVSSECPLVSVLMPAHDSEMLIGTALRGLIEQTWWNLEIVVVDDCSRDGTANVVAEFASEDDRIKLIKHEVNTGAYGARRTALVHAKGTLITVHDADDWSHPEKIERQVKALREEPGIVANMSSWCRVSESMYVSRVGAIPGSSLQRQNESSLMFRRELVDEIGTWYRVRAAGDTEYIWRIQARYGRDSVQVILPDVPLSFSLSQEDSLTRTGPTHVRTIFHGTRRVYREAQKWWHKQGASSDLALPYDPESRPFYCPPNLLERNPAPRRYDVVFVADFALHADAGLYSEAMVRAAVYAGYAVGIFHWRRFDKPIMSPVRDVFQKLAAEGTIDIIAAEDRLYARHAVILDPLGPEHRLDPVPEWEVEALSVATGHPQGSGYPLGAEYDAAGVLGTLETVFGVGPRWVAVTARDRELLVDKGGSESVSDGILHPPVDPRCIAESGREAASRRPIAGRIEPGEEMYWPDTVDEVKSTYCAGQDCDIVIGGISRTLETALGRSPRNWRFVNGVAGSQQANVPREELDFFLYFPGGRGLQAAGLNVWEACAQGQVVVTEPALEPFFGAAAVYAGPDAVWPTLSALWRDAERYRQQSDLALEFARTRATTAELVDLIGEPMHRSEPACLHSG